MSHPCSDCKCRVIPGSVPVEPTITGPGLVAVVADAPTGAESLGRSIFQGPAGEVLEATLRGVIRAAGDEVPEEIEDEFAVLHAVARPTPGGKPPSIASVRSCRERLMLDLAEAEPRMVLSVGAAACAALSGTGKATPITRWRGMMRWLDLPDGRRVPWVATISPGSVVGKQSYYRDLSFDAWKAWTQREPLAPPDVEIVVPRDYEALRAALEPLEDATTISCDVETTGLRPYRNELLSVGFGADAGDGAGYSVIVPRELLGDDRVKDICWDRVYRRDVRTVFQNGKFDLQFLMRWWGETMVQHEALLGDTLLLGSLLDERPRKDRIGGLGLKDQAMFRYDVPDYHWDWDRFYADMAHDGTYPGGVTCGEKCPHPHPDSEPRADMEGMYRYQSYDTYLTTRLWFDLVDEAEAESPDLLRAHAEVMVPAMKVLAGCELRGAPLDLEWLAWYRDHLQRRIDRRYEALTVSVIDLGSPGGRDHPDKFEIGSPAQVADLMYDTWRMTPDVRKKKFKDGVLVEDRSTDKEHIEAAIKKYLGWTFEKDATGPSHDLARAARWLRMLLRWRADSKLLSTYTESLIDKADETGRVHAEFLLHGTTTGRLSAAAPNLQNIPAVDKREVVGGRPVYTLRGARKTFYPARRGFATPPGYSWLEIDYSQLELRVAAWLSADAKLADVFIQKRDIHLEVASTMFSKPPEEITKPERYLAKAVDFGILYGRQGKAIAEGEEMDYYENELGGRRWDVATAEAFIAKFLRGYPDLGRWLEENAAGAIRDYYVQTPFGRRRRFPFKPRTKWERMRIERQANNTPIQSAASDLCIQAMARIEPLLPDGAVLLFPVHDSICLEVRDDLIADVSRIAREEMELEVGGVPLTVDVEIGPSWADVQA